MNRRVALVLVLCFGSVALPGTAAAHSADYYGKFRSSYRPVQTTLEAVGTACGFGAVKRVDQLPACGNRVAPFRKRLGVLLQFLTHTPPPAKVKAQVARAVATTRVVQRFATLATLIARRDLARFKAMGGTGHPIDRAITAFNTALSNLEIDLI